MISIDRIKLDTIIKEEIDKMLKEELGISNEVNSVSNGIRVTIESQWKKCERIQTDFGVFKRCGEFPYNIFGEDYIISYVVYNFRDYESFTENSNKVQFQCNISQEHKRMHLVILAISGEIQENTFADSIQHEIEHAFQSKMKGGDLFQDKDGHENIYSLATSNLNNENYNGWISKLANIVYYSRNEELDAFVNGLYGTLQHSGWMYGEDEIVNNSTPYKIIGMMHMLKTELENNFENSDFINSAKFFGKKRKWFIAQAKHAAKSCAEKMNKVIKKARKDGFLVNEGLIWQKTFGTPPILNKLNNNKK